MRRRPRFGVAVVGAVLFGVCGAAASLAACSSSSTPNGGGFGSGNDSGPGGNGDDSSTGGGGGACTTSSTLQIHFSPMYSAFTTDSSAHTFQVPAIVTGGTGTATWSASPSTAVTFTADPTSGGTIMTVKAAGAVTVTAQVGTLCTTATLSVTSALESDWDVGNARYNNGVPLYPGCIDQKVAPLIPPDSGIDLPPPPDGGCPDAGPACTGCHGPNPTGGFFTGVLHTPEQTAGFSDDQLVDVFVNGTVPDGGPFDQNLVPYNYWQLFHTWSDIDTPALQKGMVVYLRSLTPAVEQGGLNFGGLADAGIITN